MYVHEVFFVSSDEFKGTVCKMDEDFLAQADFSAFSPLVLGNPGAIVAITVLIQHADFKEQHLRVLCEHEVTGPRLHVLYKELGKCDADATIEQIEFIHEKTDEGLDALQRLNQIEGSSPLTEEQTDMLVRMFNHPITKLCFVPNVVMPALIGRLPPPS